MVFVRSVSTVSLTAAGKRGLELGQQLLDTFDHLDGIGPGLALYVDNDGRGFRSSRRRACCFRYTVTDPGYVGEHDRGAVLIGDDKILVGLCFESS